MKVKKLVLLRFVGVLVAAGMLLSPACAKATTEDIQGLLKAMEGKEMVVTLDDGSTVRITVQDAQAAAAQQLVGERVDVRVRVRDGERELDEVRRAGEDQKFTGAIESMGTKTWTIGGRTFKVDANTEIDDGLAVGVKARVEFITLADGSLLATEIETDEDRFSGTTENITASAWVVSGKTFKVTESTRIDSGLAVGSKVEVRFTTLADGSMLATRIQEDRSGRR